MPNNLKPDTVIISSTLKGNPYVGVPLILPTILPVNLIERQPGVRPPRFVFRQVEGNIYTITINGLHVIEREGKLFAVVEEEGPAQEWVITYRENHDAYTIVKRDAPPEIGWVAPTQDESHQILVQPLLPGRSFPPSYRPQELYKFEYPEEKPSIGRSRATQKETVLRALSMRLVSDSLVSVLWEGYRIRTVNEPVEAETDCEASLDVHNLRCPVDIKHYSGIYESATLQWALLPNASMGSPF
ncbi:hypothetical protein EDC04DRAFT_2946719 [Pisolithus marmoratus]|nr:hypothetical protein EDC04DRAFT_2946719 [Pisolithus marmoratus]